MVKLVEQEPRQQEEGIFWCTVEGVQKRQGSPCAARGGTKSCSPTPTSPLAWRGGGGRQAGGGPCGEWKAAEGKKEEKLAEGGPSQGLGSKEGRGAAIMPGPEEGVPGQRVDPEEIAKVVEKVLQSREEAKLAGRAGEDASGRLYLGNRPNKKE